jgi:hypothetical protein
MKTSIAFALLLAFGAVAQATLAPLDPRPSSPSSNHGTVYVGFFGATPEADYFQAPRQSNAAGRAYLCRLELRIFDKTRLAQSCD